MSALKISLILLLCLGLVLCLIACGRAEQHPENDPAVSNTEKEPVSGGWSTGKPSELTAEQSTLFEEAMEGMTGVNYTPILYLGFQVVGGMNHRFLCKALPDTSDTPETWAVLEIYDDMEGNAEVTSVIALTEEQAAQYTDSPIK